MLLGNGYLIMSDRLVYGRHLLALGRRPVLLWEAIRAAFAVRAHRGLIPSSEYLGWRVHTAYGDAMSPIPSEDLAAFLRWRRMMRRVA